MMTSRADLKRNSSVHAVTGAAAGHRSLSGVIRGTMLSQPWTLCWMTSKNLGLSQRTLHRLPAQSWAATSAATAPGYALSACFPMHRVAPLFQCVMAMAISPWKLSAESLATRCAQAFHLWSMPSVICSLV